MFTTIVIYGERAASGRQADADKTWPIILYRRLVLRYKENLTFANFSLPEQTTDQVQKRFLADSQVLPENLKEDEQIYALFCLGQNDAMHLKNNLPPRVSLENFKINIQNIINQARATNIAPIFLSPTPVTETKINMAYAGYNFFNAELAQYTEALAKLCQDNDVIFFDTFNEWIKEDYTPLLNPDGWHPSYAGQRRIFDQISQFFGLDW